MKTLANCTDIEFIQQCGKILKESEKLYKIASSAGDANGNEKQKLFDAVCKCMIEAPAETKKVLRLAAFLPDESEADVETLLSVFFEIINSKRVVNFFLKMAYSGLLDTGRF